MANVTSRGLLFVVGCIHLDLFNLSVKNIEGVQYTYQSQVMYQFGNRHTEHLFYHQEARM